MSCRDGGIGALRRRKQATLASGTVNLVRSRSKNFPPPHSEASRLPSSLLAVPGGPMKRMCSPDKAARSISLTSTSLSPSPALRHSRAPSGPLVSEAAGRTLSVGVRVGWGRNKNTAGCGGARDDQDSACLCREGLAPMKWKNMKLLLESCSHAKTVSSWLSHAGMPG